MKFLVLGCGSIGRRHIRNLVYLGERDIVAVDPVAERLAAVAAEHQVATAKTLRDGLRTKPDVALICTPTAGHVADSIAVASAGCHLFIEKPVGHSLEGREQLLRLIEKGRGEDCCPVIASGDLYWTRSENQADVVVIPMAGGEPRIAAEGGFLPHWSPDGRHVAFTHGTWRVADWALNLDGWVVDLDSQATAVSAPKPFVVGYGEDMSPAWSPDGRWIAYHSHRSADPVPFYSAQR